MFLCCSSQLHHIYTKLLFNSLQQTLQNRTAAERELIWEEDLHTCFTVSVTLKVNARTQPIGHTRACTSHTRADYSQAHLILLISFHSRGHSLHTDLESQNDTGWRSLLRSLVYASLPSSSPRPHPIELQNISRTEESTTPQSLCSNVWPPSWYRSFSYIYLEFTLFQLVSFALALSPCTSRRVWQHLFHTRSTHKVAKGSIETPP